MTIAFVGREQVSAAQVIILAGALRLYLRTGMKPNRAYTPAGMRAAATRLTGVEYPRGRKGLMLASDDLEMMRAELLRERRASVKSAGVAGYVGEYIPEDVPKVAELFDTMRGAN